MGKVTKIKSDPEAGYCLVPMEALAEIVAGFEPEKIGLVRAWDELYCACQAANAPPELLQAIHDIKESIEDAEAGRG
ncbi:MAG: hypothetical protein IT558_02455 [Alphaproteobacteria bacterium]|nr:hypothetical protein [Alphaproteobacteria bacterium]